MDRLKPELISCEGIHLYMDITEAMIKASEQEGKVERAQEIYTLRETLAGLLANPASPDWEQDVFDEVREKIDRLIRNPDDLLFPELHDAETEIAILAAQCSVILDNEQKDS